MRQSSDLTRRFRRPTWRDPRLGLGVVLVAASIAAGSWAVAQASHTVQVYATTATLAPGEALDVTELAVKEAWPGEITQRYLMPSQELAPDTVITRGVGSGELIPRSAIGKASDLEVRPVTVPLPHGAPQGLSIGARADLWLIDPAGPGESSEPRSEPELLANDLDVADIAEAEGLLAANGSSAQVLVPHDELADVLDALSAEGELVLLPVPGGEA